MKRKFSRFLSAAITQHPASFATRRESALEILTRPYWTTGAEYLDEVLGISGHRLWRKEQRMSPTSRTENEELCGVGRGPYWFSHYTTLVRVAEYAQGKNLRQVVDLGCGTGRLGLLIGFLFPDLHFKGIELQTNRVEAARAAVARWGLAERIQITRQDLLDPDQFLPEADLYYIFGPTNNDAINARVLERIKASRRSFHLISSLGRTTSLLKQADWARPMNLDSRGRASAYLVEPQ